MSKSQGYRLIEASLDDAWDNFVVQSDSGTAFSSSMYLDSISCKKQAYYCYKTNELVAAVLLLLSDDEERVIGHDFVVYDGLIYRNMPYLNKSQELSERFKIQSFVFEKLTSLYEEINVKLHPCINDIRPTLWVNYGTGHPRYKIDVRYTSYVDISDFKNSKNLNDIGIYQNASVARRQEIRYARKKNVKTELINSSGRFTDYYKLTMARQGIEIDVKYLNAIDAIIKSLLDNKSGLVFSSKTSSGEVGSMSVFMLDSKRGYYLFGASEPRFRNQHTGTSVIWDALHHLSIMGVNEVDLEGVNSPKRGWFKLSFGGDLISYYFAQFKQTKDDARVLKAEN